MSGSSPNRCRTCWRTGHTSRAHAGLTSAELELVKAEGREFMGRGFRELGEPARDGDLFDQLRADTEAAELAAANNPANNPAADLASFEGPKQDTPDLLGALQASVDRARAGRAGAGDPGPLFARTDGAITGGMPGWSVDHADPPLAPTVGDFPAGFRDHFGITSPEVPKEEDPPTSPLPDEYYGRDPSPIDDGCLGEQGPQFAPWRTVLGPDGPKLITLPGVYDLEAAEYHDPQVTGDWLSNSDARQLIGRGCPAQFRYDKDHGVKQENDAFAMGHAVHARILGKGETIAVRPAEFDSWRTNASKAWRAEQEAAGRSVILPEQAEVVEAMAVAVHSKPDAHRLLSQPGRPEMSLFWVDPETGVRRRTMVDYLPSVVDEYGVMEPVDIKSADEVAPNEDMERKLYNHAWHRQGTTIADGIVALGLAAEVSFNFIVQSKTAPHIVTVVKLDAEAERIGHIENREALHVYKRCLETDEWPDFTPQGPVTLTVPVWVARLYEEDIR